MSKLSNLIQKGALNLARAFFPVVTLGSRTYVLRDADVREILTRDQDFTLRQINQANIDRHLGAFMLGMDDGPEYQRENGILRSVVHKNDMKSLQDFFHQESGKLAAEMEAKGRFEVIDEYLRTLCIRFFEFYMGVPGPDPKTMMHWNRSLFWDSFLNLKDDLEVRKVATQSGKELSAYFFELIAQNKAVLAEGGQLPDNLLSRLLRLQGTEQPAYDDDGIRRNLSGSLLGMMENTSKACVNILDQLFQRKEALAMAIEAANNNDVERVGKIAFEALRFRSNIPVLIRYAEKTQYVGPEGGKKRRIKAGKEIFSLVISANFDSRRYPKPRQFNPDRPRENHLFFGYGLHKCFGTYVNYISIPEMMTALLKIKGLQPQSKKAEYEGPFPSKWHFKAGN